MATEIKVNKFTTTTVSNADGYTISLFADGVLVKQTKFGSNIPIAQGEKNVLFSAENFGEFTEDFNTKYVLATPEPAPPPPTTPTPTPSAINKDTKSKQVKYIAKTKYNKPKSTPGGEFTYKDTGKDYKGSYFEDYKKRYFAGATPDDKGGELIKVRTELPGQLLTAAAALLAIALKSFFKPKVKNSDKNKGSIKRYFVQSKNTTKIAEVSKEDYLAIRTELPNKNFATVDWIIKGPAEDKNFNGYPFEGAASKNKKAIQALEKQMPGISTFITDYSFLVEDPTANQQPVLSSTTVIEKDPEVKLENDRKANFDLRK